MRQEPLPPPDIPDYELLRPIGHGSYGEVWLARSVTGVFRVIKIVRRDRFDSDRPFLRELEGITRFQSAVSGRPRQLALLHVGRNVDAGYFYYVMEPADDAVDGSAINPHSYVPLTLRELLKRRGRLPATECLHLSLELARGLTVLHDSRLIHRDIKPSNIIFVQGVPKLADVGLVAGSESTMTCVGTSGYVPPEGAGSPTADIYSLGKVLYEISTGLDRMEFPRLPAELADANDVALISEINTVVTRACHPDPSLRHKSANDFARDLEILQAGKSVAFYERLRRQLRTLAVAAALVVSLGALFVAFLLWSSSVQRRANERTRLALYRSDLAVAQLAKAGGDLGRARAALARQVPRPGERDIRGIEWSILAGEVRGEGLPLQSLTNGVAIRKIATDPSGRWAAAHFDGDFVGVWDLHSQKVVRVIPDAKVLGGFSPDGAIVIDEPVRALRYESPTNGTLRRINTGQRLVSLLPDGKALVVTPDGDLIPSLYDPHSSNHLQEFNATKAWPSHFVSSIGINPTGHRAIFVLVRQEGALRDRLLASVDFSTQNLEWELPITIRILWIRCSPDNNTYLANIGGLSPVLGTFLAPSNHVRLRGHTARVEDAAFSHDGRYIATASADQSIRIWNTASGLPIAEYRGFSRSVSAVTWAANDTAIVAGDEDGTIRVFPFPKPPNSTIISELYGDLNGDIIYSPNGDLVAVTESTNSLAVVSTKEIRKVRSITNLFQPVLFEGKSEAMVALANDWTVWRVNLISDEKELIGSPVDRDFTVSSWSLSPDSTRLALAGTKGEVVVYPLLGGNRSVKIAADTNTIWAMSFTPDANEIWIGTTKGAIFRFETQGGNLISTHDKIEGDIQAIAFSNDGKWVAFSLFNDASVRLFDRERKSWHQPIKGHARFALSLAFTATSDRLISGGADGRVIVWRVPQFEEIAALEVGIAENPTGDEGVSVFKISPDGNSIAALTEDGRLKIWKGEPLRQNLPYLLGQE